MVNTSHLQIFCFILGVISYQAKCNSSGYKIGNTFQEIVQSNLNNVSDSSISNKVASIKKPLDSKSINSVTSFYDSKLTSRNHIEKTSCILYKYFWEKSASGRNRSCYKRHKTSSKCGEGIGDVCDELVNNFSINGINLSSSSTSNSTAFKADVDKQKKQIILVNGKRLHTKSHSPLDNFQAIKTNQGNSRQTNTSHQGGIKGLSKHVNYFGQRKNSPRPKISLFFRQKRDNRLVENSDFVYDEIEINSLSDVYIYLHTVLNHLKTSVNFTMRTNEPNATSDAENVCIHVLDTYYSEKDDDGQMYCPSSWDNFSCWPRTLAGTLVTIPCPGYLDGVDDNYNASKFCHENGTWADKAVYDMCVKEDESSEDAEMSHAIAVRIIYNVGFCTSTLALIVALFIFLYFRSLRCLRNSIHCHLIVSFIIKNIAWIIIRHALTYLQDPAYSWVCKSLTSLFNFAHTTNFYWMFVEGLYLHTIIVWTYSADKIKLWYLLIVGWGFPIINIIGWIIVRILNDNDHCWLPKPDGASPYDYIYIAPILSVLLANTIFLSTIVWVLITKLRASHSLETRQYRKAVKATIILFPLLGITYVLFITPPSNHPQVKLAFEYINAILQSFQGLMVAIFYCFLNGEVKGVLKKKISRFNDARTLSTKYTRTSYGWSRGSRDFTNTVTLANGALVDPNHRIVQTAIKDNVETIPLTDTTNADSKPNDYV